MKTKQDNEAIRLFSLKTGLAEEEAYDAYNEMWKKINFILEILKKESDRGAILVLSAVLEEQLKKIFPINSDKKDKRTFGVLIEEAKNSSINTKLEFFESLDKMNEIRINFAHKYITSFKNLEVKSENFDEELKQEIEDLRTTTISCADLIGKNINYEVKLPEYNHLNEYTWIIIYFSILAFASLTTIILQKSSKKSCNTTSKRSIER